MAFAFPCRSTYLLRLIIQSDSCIDAWLRFLTVRGCQKYGPIEPERNARNPIRSAKHYPASLIGKANVWSVQFRGLV